MTNSPIGKALAEMDYATERVVDYFISKMPASFDIGVEDVSKIDDVGRLTRKLAKVSQETAKELADDLIDHLCPCNDTYKCNGEDDHRCCGAYETCKCEDINVPGAIECKWHGHRAIAALPIEEDDDA